MAAKNSLDLDSDPRSIIGVREFDAPRDLVFAAWTDPQHLAHWWGPNGFTTTTFSFDLRPGGVWRFVMHGPDAAIIRTASPLRKSCGPNASFIDMAAMTANWCTSGRPSPSKTLTAALASLAAATSCRAPSATA
jgi:hypothetical protein